MKSLPALFWANIACVSFSRIITQVGASSPELTNIALSPNALATQSSTCHGGVASRAIDNNTDPTWAGGSMSHTCNFPDVYGWWMVQLDNVTDAYQEIHQIIVYNRQDSYLRSLSYSWVEVLDDKQLPVFSQKLPVHSPDASWTIDFEQPLIGKYVRLRSILPSGLIIPEVQVIGRPAIIQPPSGLAKNIAISPNAFAFQSSTCYGGKASHGIDGNDYGNWATNKGSMVHTCSPETDDTFSWWMVDLDAVTSLEQVIKEIAVHNRIDQYLARLSYSYVEVLDSYMNTVFSEKLIPNSKDPAYNFEFNPPLVGRFVRVRMYNKFSPLIMAEVAVIGFPITDMTEQPTSEPTLSPSVLPSAAPITPTSQPSEIPSSSPTEPMSTNIALLGNATQSTTCNGGEASRGIDGNTDPRDSTHTCEDDPDPSWWMVDLAEESGTEQVINQVTIFNRNMYLTQLAYAQIQVFDSEMKMVAFKDFPKFWRDYEHSWEFDPPAVGRYVKVQMKVLGSLHFAEIQIWGHPFTGTTATPPTVPSAMCPPPFDRPEGLQPDDQLVLAGALQKLREHMAAGPSSPLLNQTEIMAATDDFLAKSHQLSATYDFMDAALSLVEEYEGYGGYGLPVSYGPPVLDGRQFSRERGALDGRELDRSMMLIQQDILDQMYHSSLWGDNDIPKPTSSNLLDWSYKPVVKECQELFRGRKWWAAKYTPGLVDPPADPTVVHTELVKADYPTKWGRPIIFSNLKRAIYPIGGLYLAPGGVAQVTVPQSIVDHGGYHIQIGSHMVGCSRNEFKRQERMTSSFPVNDLTTFIANPFGGELYIRAPYGSIIPNAEVSVTGDVVQSATFFYSSLRNTTEEEWNTLRATAPAPWVHIVTDPLLKQWDAQPVKDMTYSFMVERAHRYTVAYNAAGVSHGFPPEKRNTWVLFDIKTICGRASVGSVGYPQANNGYQPSIDGPLVDRYEFDVHDPVIGWGGCCGHSPSPHAHDPEGSMVNYDTITWHELGHQAMHRYSYYNGGEKESLVHMTLFAARLALEGDNDKSPVDPTGIDTSFMFSCCKQQNPFTWAPRYTIDRQAIEWMTRENFRNGLEMSSEETRYQHRGHVKYADIARLTGGLSYFNEFMKEEHERWESEGLGEGLGRGGSDFWDKVSDTTWFPEYPEVIDWSNEARTLRFSIKARQDLSPLLHFWGIHANFTLLTSMMVARDLYPSQEQKDLILKYKNLIPQDSLSLEASFREIWVPEITTKNFDEWQQRADAWNQTMIDQAEAVIDNIIETHWPAGSRKLFLRAPTNLMIGQDHKSPPAMPAWSSRSLTETADFDHGRNKWMSRGPAMHYKFTFEREFMGPEDLKGPFEVTVVDGVVTQVEYAREEWQEIVVSEIDLSQIPTIEGLFDFISDSMEKPDDLVHVMYDAATGYPKQIHVEYDGEDEDESEDDIEFMTIYVSVVTIIGAEAEN